MRVTASLTSHHCTLGFARGVVWEKQSSVGPTPFFKEKQSFPLPPFLCHSDVLEMSSERSHKGKTFCE